MVSVTKGDIYLGVRNETLLCDVVILVSHPHRREITFCHFGLIKPKPTVNAVVRCFLQTLGAHKILRGLVLLCNGGGYFFMHIDSANSLASCPLVHTRSGGILIARCNHRERWSCSGHVLRQRRAHAVQSIKEAIIYKMKPARP